MKEVNLIVSETKKMGVVDDMQAIRHYQMQDIRPLMHSGPMEGAVPIDDTVDIEEYKIRKMIIKGEPVYYAVDEDMETFIDTVIGAYRADINGLHHEVNDVNRKLTDSKREVLDNKQKLMAARLQLDVQTKSAKTAWETYYANILFLMDAPFLTRMKFLLTGKMY